MASDEAPGVRARPTEPGVKLAVKPKRACEMLDVGLTRLYELMNTGELESYLDGSSRKITVASIHAYVTRRLDEARAGKVAGNGPVPQHAA